MADGPENELCDDVTLTDSQVWIPRVDEFRAKYKIEAIQYHEGRTFVYIEGRGEVALGDLYKSAKRTTVDLIKGGKQ